MHHFTAHLDKTATDNIRKVLCQATKDDIAKGVVWYAQAREMLDRVAIRYDLEPDLVYAICAALSPGKRWGLNYWQTITVARALSELGPGGLKEDHIPGALYRSAREQPYDIATTGDIAHLSGQKVTAFYQNFTGNYDEVTVDRHAYNIALGARFIKSEKGDKSAIPDSWGSCCLTPLRYKIVADAYREAGAEIGLSPAQAQAVAWVTWRRLHDLKD